jgi:hypothetical protein
LASMNAHLQEFSKENGELFPQSRWRRRGRCSAICESLHIRPVPACVVPEICPRLRQPRSNGKVYERWQESWLTRQYQPEQSE